MTNLLSFRLTLSAKKLDAQSSFGVNSFLVITQIGSTTGVAREVYRTEVVENSPSPQWRSFVVPVAKLAGNEVKHTMQLLFECFHVDKDEEILIGSFKVLFYDLSVILSHLSIICKYLCSFLTSYSDYIC